MLNITSFKIHKHSSFTATKAPTNLSISSSCLLIWALYHESQEIVAITMNGLIRAEQKMKPLFVNCLPHSHRYLPNAMTCHRPTSNELLCQNLPNQCSANFNEIACNALKTRCSAQAYNKLYITTEQLTARKHKLWIVINWTNALRQEECTNRNTVLCRDNMPKPPNQMSKDAWSQWSSCNDLDLENERW